VAWATPKKAAMAPRMMVVFILLLIVREVLLWSGEWTRLLESWFGREWWRGGEVLLLLGRLIDVL
jgi:hypothetical protein